MMEWLLQNKISKAEDAPLMDNEYRLGIATPLSKSPTATDLGNMEKNPTSLNQVNSKCYLIKSSQ